MGYKLGDKIRVLFNTIGARDFILTKHPNGYCFEYIFDQKPIILNAFFSSLEELNADIIRLGGIHKVVRLKENYDEK